MNFIHRTLECTFFIIGFSALLLLIGGEAAAKNYTRSCGARYSVTPTSISGGHAYTFQFQGRGTVGYYNPNEARRRARRNIDECIDTHWAHRTATSRPDQCRESNQVYNYPLNSWAVDIRRNICRLNPGHDTITVTVNVLYSGDKGCYLRNNSWSRTIARGYVVHCAAGSEFESNVDRPGMDIRSINLPAGAHPSACRNACLREPGCRAWTYVRAGVQGPQPRCWLKSGVPRARRSNCCTSGVITELH